MGLMGAATSHIPDLGCAEPGEYLLRCTDAEEKLAKTGRDMIALKFDIVEVENAFPVFHNVLGAKPGDKQSTADAMERGIKQAKLAFGYGPDDAVETADLIGAEVTAVLKEELGNNGPRNVVHYFVTGQAGPTETENTETESAPV